MKVSGRASTMFGLGARFTSFVLRAGDWRAGHRHGIGVYIWGERMHQYDGDWTDDTPHGEGTAVLGDGSAYTVRHGIGSH